MKQRMVMNTPIDVDDPDDPFFDLANKALPFKHHAWASPEDVAAFAAGSEAVCPDLDKLRFDLSASESMWNLYIFKGLVSLLKQKVSNLNLPTYPDRELYEMFRHKYIRGVDVYLRSVHARLPRDLPGGGQETPNGVEMCVNHEEAGDRQTSRHTSCKKLVRPLPSCSSRPNSDIF